MTRQRRCTVLVVAISLAAPALAMAPASAGPGGTTFVSVPAAGVTWLTARPIGNRCVRFKWGGTRLRYYERYEMKIRGANDARTFRWSGKRTRLKVCKFPVNAYTVWVRKTATPWRTASFEVGNPQVA